MTALKRQANLQATTAYVQPPTLAIEPHKRNVVFHLTPWAPGCEMSLPSDRTRCFEVFNRRPGQAMDALCRRLEVGPRAIALTGLEDGSVSVHPIDQPRDPWAFIWRGLTFAEARTALDKLIELETRR
ncbi:hypothetical protein [Caulobacter sp. RL271]|uniref:Uncharacterized protein n=1 Tax=Caulobacter segnis TaxID=88688 RepID=A0ABY4ZXB5_9CAUL|nr:hypothetical protein [Caulobacter segnis]USQ97279.1 hypothetical protein MZV50_06970 [Caulobacter segnis]